MTKKTSVLVVRGEFGFGCPACGRVLGFVENDPVKRLHVRSHEPSVDQSCKFDNQTFRIPYQMIPAEVVDA